ncbi:MAG TPA: OPT/YSL family transporter, partial [Phycisphaerae bacterium]
MPDPGPDRIDAALKEERVRTAMDDQVPIGRDIDPLPSVAGASGGAHAGGFILSDERRVGIKQLNDEQVRTWSLEQKDRWWLENVFRGNMPQLTLRSGLTGFLLGGILSATNLYVGAKTGWTLGVGITSVILAFALFKALASVGLAREFTILENNAMQSIATAAGYMTAPLISSLSAYMLVTNQVIPTKVMMIWIMVIAILGVLFAFPMKRRFINDEQQPFPEGRACGVVMEALHTGDAAVGLLKAKVLLVAALTAGLIRAVQGEGIMGLVQHKLFRVPREKVWHFHENLDDYYYALAGKFGLWMPKIAGTPLRELALRPALDLAMIGAGGLMGIRTTISLLIGALLNFAIIAPIMIHTGHITGRTQPDGSVTFGRTLLLNWGLWWGVAMMVVASLVGFFAKPEIVIGAFKGLLGKRRSGANLLKHIELPLSVFVIGIPIVGAVTIWMAHLFFGVKIWHGVIAIPLVFILSLIAANSTALTSITPTGSLSKITQLTFGALAPQNMQTNLMTAGITSEVSSNTANLLMDIKPGYMLGGKPR